MTIYIYIYWVDLSPGLKNLFCFGNFPAWEGHGNPTHWPSCAHKDWSEFSTHWPSCAHIYPLAGEQCKCAMHELMGRTLLTSPALDLPPSTKWQVSLLLQSWPDRPVRKMNATSARCCWMIVSHCNQCSLSVTWLMESKEVVTPCHWVPAANNPK